MSSPLRQRITDAVMAYLNESPTVDGYPVPRWECVDRNIYRLCDSALDLDVLVQLVIENLSLTKELRCGELLAVDDPIDTETHFSSQHRYVTDWLGD